MLIEYTSTSLTEIADKILPLIKNHYDEISIFKDYGYEFDPLIESYHASSQSEFFKVYTAKFEDELLGYVFFCIYPNHPHCRKIKMAMMDMIYLDPKYRGKGIGKSLLECAHKDLKTHGVNMVIAAMSKKYDFSEMLNSMDYKLMDYLFIKEI